MLQPVVVRAATGRRRTLRADHGRAPAGAAARRPAWRPIPAIVRDTADDAMLRDALLENLHRSQLNPLEEAAAYQQLLEDFGVHARGAGQRIGRSPPADHQHHPAAAAAGAGAAAGGRRRAVRRARPRAAGPATTRRRRSALATRIVAEGLSVRAVEEIVALGRPDPAAGRTARRARAPARPGARRARRAGCRTGFETRVKVEIGPSQGHGSTIEFGRSTTCDRIVGVMAPERPGADLTRDRPESRSRATRRSPLTAPRPPTAARSTSVAADVAEVEPGRLDRHAAAARSRSCPGATLTSRNHGVPSASTTRSARDRSRRPSARCAATAQLGARAADVVGRAGPGRRTRSAPAV